MHCGLCKAGGCAHVLGRWHGWPGTEVGRGTGLYISGSKALQECARRAKDHGRPSVRRGGGVGMGLCECVCVSERVSINVFCFCVCFSVHKIVCVFVCECVNICMLIQVYVCFCACI